MEVTVASEQVIEVVQVVVEGYTGGPRVGEVRFHRGVNATVLKV